MPADLNQENRPRGGAASTVNSRRARFFQTLIGDASRNILPAPEHPIPSEWPPDGVIASWLGHATVLAKVDGVMILTDPVLFSRCGIRVGSNDDRPKALRGVRAFRQ